MDITEFLAKCLDEEARALPSALNGPWRAVGDRSRFDRPLGEVEGRDILIAADGAIIAENVRGNAVAHIARHDPARVLREVAAKRRVLARHHDDDGDGCYGCGFGNDEERMVKDVNDCPELRDMASVYEDRPGYKEEWKL